VNFCGDATYVLSGSDDTNIRVWKAKASEQLGVVCTSSNYANQIGLDLFTSALGAFQRRILTTFVCICRCS